MPLPAIRRRRKRLGPPRPPCLLRRGSDADIVVYDPKASHVIRADDCVANVDYNPYEGFVTSGGIRQVWLRGRLAVEDGKVLDQAPQGKYMARGKNSL